MKKYKCLDDFDKEYPEWYTRNQSIYGLQKPKFYVTHRGAVLVSTKFLLSEGFMYKTSTSLYKISNNVLIFSVEFRKTIEFKGNYYHHAEFSISHNGSKIFVPIKDMTGYNHILRFLEGLCEYKPENDDLPKITNVSFNLDGGTFEKPDESLQLKPQENTFLRRNNPYL